MVILIIVLVIIAFELGLIIQDLEKFFTHYFDGIDDIKTSLNSIRHCIYHSKTDEELKRIEKREEQQDELKYKGLQDDIDRIFKKKKSRKTTKKEK